MEPRWTLVDFVLAVLGGFGGALAAAGVAAVLTNAENTVLLASYAGQFVGTLGVLWLIARGRGLDADSLGFDIRPTDSAYLGLGVALQIGVALAFIPLQQILVPEGGFSQEQTELFTRLDTAGTRVVMAAITTFMAPLTEELMFRGVLLRTLVRRSRWVVMVVTSLVFALVHVASAASPRAAVLVFLQIFVVGLVLAHLTLRHRRLGPAIFVHAGFNLLTTLFLLAPPELLEQLEDLAAG